MEKYTLDDKHRNYLREKRISRHLSAEKVSENLHHHKSWLGQIERGRLVSIKKDELNQLLSILFDVPLSYITDGNFADLFYTSHFETEKSSNKIIDKLSDSIDEHLPNRLNSTSSYIRNKMKQITNLFCDEQKNSESQFLNTMIGLGQFHINATENSNYTLLFLCLRLNEIFKKYKDNPEIILEIYDYIKSYIDSKLSDDESNNT